MASLSDLSASDPSSDAPPRRRLGGRTLSTVERDTLHRVLHIVEREADADHTKGMSRATFFLGLANLVGSAFLLGAFPQSFWLVYAVQGLFIIGGRFRDSWTRSEGTPTKPSTMLYYWDLCWVANFLLAAAGMLVFIEVVDERYFGMLQLRIAQRTPTAGLLACLLATGPLGWSVFVLPCKMVLHDIANYANTFIHLWPVFTTLSMRWASEAVVATYPGHFDSLFEVDVGGFLRLVVLASKTYFVWWVPFTVWMLVNGRFQSPERTGRDTIYLRLMMNDAVAAATCGVRAPPRGTAIGTTPPHSLDDAAAAAAVLKYLVIHAMACHLSFVSSALCMISIEIHLGFALAGLLFSLYLGSVWYDKMLTRNVTTKVRRHIDASAAAAKRE
mmetsp:Transcript_12977/g.40013  ORF Transcript_12977/g.40013 Transcript_12977/m.40013 type:complete len:387 (+) Transcript_12977:485-1645(+)